MKDQPRATVEIEDPAIAGGDWRFRLRGQIYGPVDGPGLAALLYRGDADGSTPVSFADGPWRPLAEVPAFLVHVRKAEASLRVEQEVTGQRLLRTRRARARRLAAVVGGALVVALAAGVALLVGRGDAIRSPLLEGFGAGISIAAPTRVAVADADADADAGVDVEPGGEVGRPTAARAARRVAHGVPGVPPDGGPAPAGDGDGLVAARFDPARIQAAVARQQRTLAPCLRDAAAGSPGSMLEVPLEFTIGNDGRVVRVAIDDPRLRDGALRACLERVLAGWSFDRFPGQRPTVSIAFRVGG